MNSKARRRLAEDLANLIPTFHQKFIYEVNFPVPPNHFLTLIRLHSHGTQTITHLSERLLISKQQMSPIIEKLLKSGFVTRKQNPKDRRCVEISLTEKGFAVLQGHHDTMVRNLEKKLASFNEQEMRELDDNLQGFFNLFNKLP